MYSNYLSHYMYHKLVKLSSVELEYFFKGQIVFGLVVYTEGRAEFTVAHVTTQ